MRWQVARRRNGRLLRATLIMLAWIVAGTDGSVFANAVDRDSAKESGGKPSVKARGFHGMTQMRIE